MHPDTRRHLLSISLIALLSIFAFINTFQNEFVYDDIKVIVEDINIRNWKNLPHILAEGRPIKTITFMVDYKLWGFSPFGYHLTNLILHILCSISLYLLLTMIFGNYRVPLFTGLLFAVHPVHTESVTAIAKRKDIIDMLLFIW